MTRTFQQIYTLCLSSVVNWGTYSKNHRTPVLASTALTFESTISSLLPFQEWHEGGLEPRESWYKECTKGTRFDRYLWPPHACSHLQLYMDFDIKGI